MNRFAAASEQENIVYGSATPGYSQEEILEWIEFMQGKDIQRVCCLLAPKQLNNYANLLDLYKQEFGSNKVCWAPIEDFNLIDSQTLTQKILPFLKQANDNHEKVVVHCFAGIGRTGQVLAAWLVYARGLSNQEAISTVMRNDRNPCEFIVTAAKKGQHPSEAISQLDSLLDNCRNTK